jgi:hypothetical protein
MVSLGATSSFTTTKTSAGARAMHGFGAEVWYTIVS